jgi:translation initiation factor eIF-2B subunit delta
VSVESVLRGKEGGSVHPAVLALGLRYADGTIKGSTARCVAMVNALCQVSRLRGKRGVAILAVCLRACA